MVLLANRQERVSSHSPQEDPQEPVRGHPRSPLTHTLTLSHRAMRKRYERDVCESGMRERYVREECESWHLRTSGRPLAHTLTGSLLCVYACVCMRHAHPYVSIRQHTSSRAGQVKYEWIPCLKLMTHGICAANSSCEGVCVCVCVCFRKGWGKQASGWR